MGAQSRDYNSDVAEGSIFFQNPSGGENVEPGTAVDVTVSLGPEQVEVPEVYGLSVAAAQTALSNVGLNSTPIEVEGDEPAGTALDGPGVGAMLDPGSTVTSTTARVPLPLQRLPPIPHRRPTLRQSRTIAGPRSAGPDEGPPATADNRPIDRNATTTPDNSGSGSSGQGSSGQGSSGLVAVAEGRARKRVWGQERRVGAGLKPAPI